MITTNKDTIPIDDRVFKNFMNNMIDYAFLCIMAQKFSEHRHFLMIFQSFKNLEKKIHEQKTIVPRWNRTGTSRFKVQRTGT